MTPSSQELESPGNPGRFRTVGRVGLDRACEASEYGEDRRGFCALSRPHQETHQPNPTPSDRRRACACRGKGRFCLRRTHRHYSQRLARDPLRSQGVSDWWFVLDDFGLRDLGWESGRFNSRGNHDRPSSRTLRAGPAPGRLRWRVFFKGKLGSHQRQGS